MKKFFKVFAIMLLSIILLGFGSCFLLSEKLPIGDEGVEAELLTDKMFLAVNKEAWDTTKIVQWDFMGIHQYIWNKETEDLQVKWRDVIVTMNLAAYDGKVTENGVVLENDEKRKKIDKAFAFFCNDSFWLNAPVKARDEGTTRSLVTLEDGEKALLVSYSSGGVTPGDSYLWILDKNGLPVSWKMWTKVLPIDGVQTTWDEYITLKTGAKLATKHGNKIYNMKLENINSGQSYEELGITNPFINYLENL